MSAELNDLGETLRRQDHDRYVTALFADPAKRADLWVLYSFNLELAQIRTLVREPVAGMIRLQWWREVIEGGRRHEALRHPVGAPLVALIERCGLPVDGLVRMVEARERDLDPMPFADHSHWQAYGRDSAGTLVDLACRVLGRPTPAAEAVGTAWALTGLLRSLPFHLAQNWLTLPHDALVQHGLDPQAVLAARAEKGVLDKVVDGLAAEVQSQLKVACGQEYRRQVVPALLPAVLARAYLRRMRALGGDVFAASSHRPRPMPMRLAWAALSGRI